MQQLKVIYKSTQWNTFNVLNFTAWNVLISNETSTPGLDALVEGCSVCEREQCDGSVGYGGSPDENGETTLDAMIMDGKTMNVGAVAGMRYIKDAIAVARHVLENTRHTLLVGERATEFAIQMGFTRETLATDKSMELWTNWKANNCQPNFWLNVVPDATQSCGPYEPESGNAVPRSDWSDRGSYKFGPDNHDTIGMVIIDGNQQVFAGTSTNGATHKIPGRVGDSPIAGSGAYADGTVGGAAATGDGDIMMRFLPSLRAVEELRRGVSPNLAGELALRKIAQYYSSFSGGIVVATIDGDYGAACYGMESFPYSVYDPETRTAVVETVKCFTRVD